MRLEGKTALITGAGRGIGKAIATRFVQDGAKIVISDILKDDLKKTAAELNALTADSTLAVVADVTNFDEVQKMVNKTVKFGGRIDILVNNAGIDPGGSIVNIPIEQWKKILDVNVNGPFYCMRAAIPKMIKQGGGSIVNIGSLAGVRCLPDMPAYCTSKGGLIQLSAQCALEYGPHKIRSNVVAPGATRTEMLVNAMAGLSKILNKNALEEVLPESVPLRRPANTDEIAGAVSFLASDDSSFITGAMLLVDGGAAIVDVSGASVARAGGGWGV